MFCQPKCVFIFEIKIIVNCELFHLDSDLNYIIFYLYIYSLPCSTEDLSNFHDLNKGCGPHCTSGHHRHPKKRCVWSAASISQRSHYLPFARWGFSFPYNVTSTKAQIRCKFRNLKILLWLPKFSPSHRILTQTLVFSISARKTNSNIISKQM